MTVVELHQPVIDVDKPATEDRKFWSVTTLIGALDKPALTFWSAEQTAVAAVDQHNAWVAIARDAGRDEAIKWLTGARFRTPAGQRTAADLGTAVHAAIETYTLTGARPDVDDEVAPFLAQFDRWAQRFQPEYLATEVTVYDSRYGYAGTCDGFMRIAGMPVIFDYKTSKKSFDKRGNPTGPYPEVGLQLAAYRHAEMAAVWRPRRFEQFRRRYYLLSPDERAAAVPVPEVEGGVAIHITPDHCVAYPVRCDEQIFEQFLYVVEAARFVFETSKTLIGAPLEVGA
jgi:hypothetical protein